MPATMKNQHPVTIANYFIHKSFDSGVELTPMKLIKMVYISHGWHMAITNEELINEPVQAWRYGPMIESIYHIFKHFGGDQIMSYGLLSRSTSYTEINDSISKSILDRIWDIYAKYDGLRLSTLTHQPGSPWHIVWFGQSGHKMRGRIIPNELIKDYYRKKGLSNAGGA